MFLKTTVRQIWLASRGTRFSSSSTHAAKNGNQISSGLGRFSRSLLWISGASLFGFYATDSRAAIHSHVILPVLRQFSDAEESHVLAIWALKMGLHPSDRVPDDECLQTTVHFHCHHFIDETLRGYFPGSCGESRFLILSVSLRGLIKMERRLMDC